MHISCCLFRFHTWKNCGYDVSLYPGLRAAYSNERFRIRADFAPGKRYNTFFQNRASCNDGDGADRANNNLSVTLATFGW